jgi:hypothetical protein
MANIKKIYKEVKTRSRWAIIIKIIFAGFVGQYREQYIMKKIRHSFSIRINEEESKMIDELKDTPYHINMSNLLRDEIRKFYKRTKNGKADKT